jgi:flagellar hook-associated protein 1 FlgK
MPSTFFGIETAYSALQADQAALAVTGANIANVNTPGYSRQTVTMQTNDPWEPASAGPASPGPLGTGISVGSINRVVNAFVNQQIYSANSQNGSLSNLTTMANQVQSAFNEPSGTGIGDDMTTFFNAFSTLASDPTSESDRSTVLSAAQAVVDQFHSVSSALSQIAPQVQTQVSADVTQVNQYATQIAQLNGEIRGQVEQGEQPNDLEDQRDELINKLSGLVNVNTTNGVNAGTGQPNGVVDVSIGSFSLVQDTTAASLPSTVSTASANDLGLQNSSGQVVPVTGGEIYGLIKSQTLVAGYQSSLDNLASNLASAVNSIHKTGYGLDGSTGNEFFSASTAGAGQTQVTAANISLSAAVANNPDAIAAAVPITPTPATGEPFASGNGDIATQIAGLATTPVMGNSSLDDYYNNLIGQIGADAQNFTNESDNQTSILQQLQSQQSSASGVSLDEELSNQMMYEQAYQAAANVMSVQNTVIGTIMSTLGSVSTTS